MPKSKKITQSDYLDKEEQELIESFQGGKFLSGEALEAELAYIRDAAQHHMRKNARINIRLPNADLIQIKRRAERDGLPYQTLIASVLHRFATGQFGA
jgi:predicted DNA binding CopG/RHH family protein